jgi:O-antigen ligase
MSSGEGNGSPMQKKLKSRLTLPVASLLVYVVFTFLPLIYTYFPVFGQLKIVLVAGVVMLLSFLFTRNMYGNSGVYRNPVVFLWANFLGLMVLGIFFSIDRGTTLSTITINLKYFLVFIVMIRIIDSRQRLDLLLFVFCTCGVLMSASTILNYLAGATMFQDQENLGLTAVNRAIALDRGLFGDPNDLALLNNTLLPFMFYFMLTGRKKVVSIAAAGTVIVANVLTFSRGGFLGMSVVLASVPVFFTEYRKRSWVLVPILAVLIGIFAPTGYWDRILTITSWEVDQETGMTGTRLDAWKLVWNASLKKPLLGVGAGNSVYISGMEARDWHAIHNSFLQVLSELGIFAFVFFILFYVIPIRKYSYLRKLLEKQGDPPSLMLYKCTLISFLSYGTSALFLPQAYNPLLFMLTGIWVIQSNRIAQLKTVGIRANAL